MFKLNVNVGLYVLSHRVLSLIPSNGAFDITDLIRLILNKGGKIGVFKIKKSSWKDVGQWTEYKKAMNKIFN
jgi:dTDP-glucose pyrophosphorylase